MAGAGVEAQQVAPVPTPVTFATAPVTLPTGDPAVVLELHLVTGVVVVFVPPDGARAIAQQLTGAASGLQVAAPSGLEVPGR